MRVLAAVLVVLVLTNGLLHHALVLRHIPVTDMATICVMVARVTIGVMHGHAAVLMMMDEFAQLKRLEIIENALAGAAGYGGHEQISARDPETQQRHRGLCGGGGWHR